MSLLGKPSLKRQITTPKFNLFLAVGFPTHPTYSFMEGLVFKVRTKKVWMKAEYNSIKNFFEVSHSLFSAFSSFIHFVSHPLQGLCLESPGPGLLPIHKTMELF